ncbi:hypothetical protein Afil01_38030 [Actinorhabdospora filicis]|uniref:YcxB-like C-terminal domain-containing protein n=1 Tax=Actinorhabdospora filicis TaxID=1785913 RepID=A0A9W6WAW2_9ACTN|nr:YcxB family protein [Actinorhabdospora filicis]GLZ78996.1 hypothetical protein Afil01_38030 [Actinorhabdospora filicis]
MLIRVHTEADLRLKKRAAKYATLKQRRKLFNYGVVSVLLAVLPLAFSPADELPSAWVIFTTGYFTLCAICLFTLLCAIRSALRKGAKNSALDTRPTQYLLTEESFGFESPGEEMSLAWTLIGEVREYHDMWLIHRWDGTQVWFLPKIGMPEPDIEEFRAFLATRHQLAAAMSAQAA